MSRATDFDVLIAGGGLAGGSLALALAALPLRIGVVEAVPVDSAEQPSFDDRTIALSRGSQQILTGIGLWPAVADSAVPIREIHVSERGRFGTTRITARDQGVPTLGHVVASRTIGQALWAALEHRPNVRL